MHELAVTEGMLKVVLRHAELNRAKQVVAITLQIGEMTDIVDEWLRRYLIISAAVPLLRGRRLR